VRPIRATVEAVDELEPYLDDGTLLDRLVGMGDQVRAVAPQTIGLSVAMAAHGVTFTVVATEDEIALLDAIQYLDSGPCLAAIELGHGLAAGEQDLFDEESWRLFARATSAAGVHSTLTLPIVVAGDVGGTVNLYGASDVAFDGHHEEIARICGAWAPGAVTNADLGFTSRRTAEAAPDILRADAQIETAVGAVASALGVGFGEARERLVAAAGRAGVPPQRLAVALLRILTG
jgi:hypothetical protein